MNKSVIKQHYGRFIWGYLLANTQGALEYRLSFVSQVFAMLLNDVIWLVFWLAYFTRFPLVAGWGRTEVVTLWAVTAAAFGLATTICGNATRLASIIARGQLDVYLPLPKPVLLHVLISTMSLTAPGDVAFGLGAYLVIIQPRPSQLGLFVLCMITGAVLVVAFTVLTQSLAFWLGNAEGLGAQLVAALINFSTYPTVIFNGIVKVALFYDHSSRLYCLCARAAPAQLLPPNAARPGNLHHGLWCSGGRRLLLGSTPL
ncbi:MAG: ABC-2 family transporter protein [Herpetosiphonaceae bacterium]|nr:ABC-2 family transporter protein [Herpetosiphonaceae bacterium]